MDGVLMFPRALVVQSCPEAAATIEAAIVVADGMDAAREVDTWAPDVVLVDLTLPPLDGWFVLAAVGARPERPLLVVRVGDPNEVDRAVALGADAWVDGDVHVVAAAGKLVPAIAA
jgi:CheY-like chemotaxis protein